MWPLTNKKRTRRGDVRRVAMPAQASLWRRFSNAGGPLGMLIVVLFYTGVLLLDLWPADPFPYRVGQYIPRDIQARVDFSVPSHKRTEEETARKTRETPATFQLDAALHERIIAALKAVPQNLAPATRPADVSEELAKQMNIFTPEALDAWRAYAAEDRKAQYEAQVDKLGAELLNVGFVQVGDLEAQFSRNADKVRLGNALHPKSCLVSAAGERYLLENRLARVVEVVDPQIRPCVREYLLGIFKSQSQPLYTYDAAATQKEIETAIEAVMANPPRDPYQQGEVIVRKLKDKNKLDEGDIRLLAAEHEHYLAAEASNGWRSWGRVIGRGGIILLVVLLMSAYVFKYRRDLVDNPLRALSVALTLLVLLGINKVMIQVFQLNLYSSTLPVLMGAFVLTIAYGQRFALAMGGALALLVVLQMRQDLGILLVHAAAIAAAVALLGEIRTRSKLVVVSAAAAGAAMLSIWANGLASGIPWWPFVLIASGWAVMFALLAGFLVQGILPFIERAFRVATSMTLLEWADANKPLLRRLAMDAPGTYNHCLQLGAMCEAAADSIGARGLLARVGAYYHDIGKINKPDYFIENQGASPSKHAKLSPAMSLLIITGHVKDGLELAREYGLPGVLHEFIATHHGTTLVQYFYHAATEKRKAEAERAPDEVEFRYPGPKPHSREAAILMLADAAESSVRTLQEPTPGRIENQVHAMVMRRLMDGQLDDCELTLKDVHRIEDSLVKTLAAMHHTRVAYPTPPGQTASAAELQNKPEEPENGKENGEDGESPNPPQA